MDLKNSDYTLVLFDITDDTYLLNEKSWQFQNILKRLLDIPISRIIPVLNKVDELTPARVAKKLRSIDYSFFEHEPVLISAKKKDVLPLVELLDSLFD